MADLHTPTGQRTRAWRLPRYVRGPKPRRRTELGLLLLVWVIVALLFSLASFGTKGNLPTHTVSFLGGILALTIGVHLANRWLVPYANPVMLPLVAFLNGLGYIEIVRWNPVAAQQQATWTLLGGGLYVLTLIVVQRTRDLDRYRYLLLLVAVVLMLAPLFPVVGTSINGARLWVHLGSAIQFQPVEVAKILLAIFFASYFADKKELLSIPSARVGNRLVLDPRPLLPIILAWGFALMILGVENDIGFAMLIFAVFIALLWVATGRFTYLALGLGLFGAGAWVATNYFAQAHARIAIWLDPWSQAQGRGLQLVQTWYSMGSGGVGGTGLGLGHAGSYVPFLTTALIYGAIAEEMGFIGSGILVIALALLIGTGFHIAQRCRTDFARLAATALTLVLGFQSFFILAGVLRILPFTGITLPFVARGGSSLVANYVLIALLLRISNDAGPEWAESEIVEAEQATATFGSA